MSLSRRGFLQLLGGASFALLDGGAWRFLAQDTPVYDVAGGALADAAPSARVAAVSSSITPETLDAWTRLVAQRAGAKWLRLMREPFLIVDAPSIGETVRVPKPTRFSSQHADGGIIETRLDRFTCVDIASRWLASAFAVAMTGEQRAFLECSGDALAERLASHRQNVIGVPSVIPNAIASSIAQDPASGMTVRGVMDYDALLTLPVLRFDVVSGCAPHLREMSA